MFIEGRTTGSRYALEVLQWGRLLLLMMSASPGVITMPRRVTERMIVNVVTTMTKATGMKLNMIYCYRRRGGSSESR